MTFLRMLTRFMQFTHRFRRVKRDLPLPLNEGMENDAEHTFQLSIVAWYVINALKLPLDVGRVLKYATVHDLVEAYAGDVTCHKHDPQKQKREHEAALRLEREFPEFPDLHVWIKRYEARDPNDKELIFVYALDKLIPIVNILIAGATYWKESKVTFDDLLRVKTAKIELSPEITPLYHELIAHLRTLGPDSFAPSVPVCT